MDFLMRSLCRSLPKVVLHDHLDGGLRPETINTIMRSRNIPVPWGQEDPALWFKKQADKKSLFAYLESFHYTLTCMQSVKNIRTIAYEAFTDLAKDNVVYAELRFGPLLCTKEGLAAEAVIEAALEGMEAAKRDHGIEGRLLLCGIRNHDPSETKEVVKLAHRYCSHGVSGVDLAGPEDGYSPDLHKDAFNLAKDKGLPITIHAGEVCGLDSIASAIKNAHAQRLGHGIRILDGVQSNGELNPLLWEVLERNITLEVCPSSNVQTAAALSILEHPLPILDKIGFPVTLNTDNRLMGGTTTSQEWFTCAQAFEWEIDTAYRLTNNAIVGAFCEESVKQRLRYMLNQWHDNAKKLGLAPLKNTYDAENHFF